MTSAGVIPELAIEVGSRRWWYSRSGKLASEFDQSTANFPKRGIKPATMMTVMRFGETDLHGEANAERTRESDEANERAVIILCFLSPPAKATKRQGPRRLHFRKRTRFGRVHYACDEK